MARTFRQDIIHLRKLKLANEKAAQAKSAADAAFKRQQSHVLTRMEAEDTYSIGTAGTLFSRVQKVKGQIEDRSQYVRWALDNDEVVQEFLQDAFCDRHPDSQKALVQQFYATVTSLTLLKLKEDGTLLNQQARSHVDDGEPLPPGLSFRPDDYVSQRAA